MRVGPLRHVVAYLVLVGVPVGVLLAVVVPMGGGDSAPMSGEHGAHRHILALAAIIVVAHLGGRAAVRLRQPEVVGQLGACVALGPIALGALAPEPHAWLFGPGTETAIAALATVGMVLFLFLVGAELSRGGLRGTGRAGLVIGHAALAVPLAAGAALAPLLPAAFRPAGVDPLSFALFCGITMGITAVPVLARVLQERGVLRTPLGVLGMSSAAVCDATAWCLMAVVLGGAGLLGIVGPAVVGVVVLRAVVRPALSRLAGHGERARAPLAVALLALAFLCAWGAHQLGLHAAIGALAAGLAAPPARVVAEVLGGLEWLVRTLLLPVFFASVGLAMSPAALGAPLLWAVMAGAVALALVTKVGATLAAGRMLGLPRRDSFALAAMMNCRGLTEIVVLEIGRSAGLLTDALFTALIAMALVTTALTGPLLSAVWPRGATGLPDLPDRVPPKARPAELRPGPGQRAASQ
ncbi:cation:proton antiporter [Actinokineospora sp. 24-640]